MHLRLNMLRLIAVAQRWHAKSFIIRLLATAHDTAPRILRECDVGEAVNAVHDVDFLNNLSVWFSVVDSRQEGHVRQYSSNRSHVNTQIESFLNYFRQAELNSPKSLVNQLLN